MLSNWSPMETRVERTSVAIKIYPMVQYQVELKVHLPALHQPKDQLAYRRDEGLGKMIIKK